MAADQRLRELARTRLADFGYADAMNALIDVVDCTELPVPGGLLVEVARWHLEAVDAGAEVDPCRALRESAAGG
jgi:hypothetical protein